MVPVMERGIYPCLAKCGIVVPVILKIVLGMLLAAGSAGMGKVKWNVKKVKWNVKNNVKKKNTIIRSKMKPFNSEWKWNEYQCRCDAHDNANNIIIIIIIVPPHNFAPNNNN